MSKPTSQLMCFLCHNSRDKPLVRDVCQALRHDFGVAAYLDESQLIGGDDWNRAIHQALTTSNVCVIFVGANGWGEYQLASEARPALTRMHADPSFRVIPVPLPGATAASMAELGDLFEAKQRVDFRNADLGSAIRSLGAAIRGENPIPEGPTTLTPLRVAFDAQRWEIANRRDITVLYRGSRLREAIALRNDRCAELADSVDEFLAAAVHLEREELGRRLGAHAVVLVQSPAKRELAAHLALEAVTRCPSADVHAALMALRTQLPRQLAVLECPAPVTALAQRPIGSTCIVAGCDDGKIAFWNGQRLALARFAHGATVRAGVFDSEGQWLATGADDGTIAVWDVDRCEPRIQLAFDAGVETLQIRRVGDCALLMACSARPGTSGKVRLWSLPDGKPVAGAWTSMIAMGASLDATGSRMLIAWGDRVALVDTASGQLLGHTGPGAGVVAVDTHPVDQLAVVLTFDRALWALRIDGDPSALELRRLAEHMTPTIAPRFSENGAWLGALGDDFRMHAWHMTSGRLQTISYEGLIGVSFGFSSSGERVWVGSPERKTVAVWQLETGRQIATMRVDCPTAALFDDSEGLVLAATEDNAAKLYQLPRADPAFWSCGLGYTWSVAFGPAGRHLLWFGRPYAEDLRVGRPTIVVMALDTGAAVTTVELPDGDATDSFVRTCFDAGEAKFAVERKGVWSVWPLDGGGAAPLDQRPDWGLVEDECGVSGFLQRAPIAAACQARGGSTVAVVNADGSWLAINHDGWQISVWSLVDDTECACFSTSAEVSALAIDRDGRYVAVGDEHGGIAVHGIDGVPYAEYRHAEPIIHLSFSTNSDLLAAASADGALRLWIVSPERLAADVRRCLTAPLSDSDRLRYIGEESVGFQIQKDLVPSLDVGAANR